jgi:hypothetical protein
MRAKSLDYVRFYKEKCNLEVYKKMAASDLVSYISEQRKDAACALGDFILRRIMQSDKKKTTVATQAQISRPTLDKRV